jgi:hypothetical protein
LKPLGALSHTLSVTVLELLFTFPSFVRRALIMGVVLLRLALFLLLASILLLMKRSDVVESTRTELLFVILTILIPMLLISSVPVVQILRG